MTIHSSNTVEKEVTTHQVGGTLIIQHSNEGVHIDGGINSVTSLPDSLQKEAVDAIVAAIEGKLR